MNGEDIKPGVVIETDTSTSTRTKKYEVISPEVMDTIKESIHYLLKNDKALIREAVREYLQNNNELVLKNEKDYTREIFEEVLLGQDTKLTVIMRDIQSAINQEVLNKNLLSNLNSLRILILLLKGNYDNTTLEYEIFDEIDEEIFDITRGIKNNKFDDSKNRFEKLSEGLKEMIKGNNILFSEGKNWVVRSTDTHKGEFREFQLKKN